MEMLLLLKHFEKKIVLVMYFKNEEQAFKWWECFPCSEEWKIVYRGERKKSKHRYELVYSKFDERGQLYTKYIICYSKKESVLLAKKIKEVNSNYITNITKLY